MSNIAKKITGSRLRKNKDCVPQKTERFLTLAELRRLKKILTSQPPAASPYSLAAIWMPLLTGSCLSELLALSWGDVDLENGCFHLTSKSGSRRFVPLSNRGKRILVSLQRQADNPYVFCGQLPGTRLTEREIGKVWQHVSALAGIPDVQLPDLRHSFAALALQQGADIYKVSKVLGYRGNMGTTPLVPLGLEHLRDVTNKVAQVIG